MTGLKERAYAGSLGYLEGDDPRSRKQEPFTFYSQ